MTKYTKRQYQADISANETAIVANKQLLEYFREAHFRGVPLTAGASDAWNAAQYREYDLEKEREDIERRWLRRKWTWKDHSEHELVMMNID